MWCLDCGREHKGDCPTSIAQQIVACAECATPFEVHQELNNTPYPHRWGVKVCDCESDEVVFL